MKKRLNDMKKGQKGLIEDIKVDLKMQLKLESLGIRKGALIEKKAKMLGNGPVVVGIGNGEIALAHEVANYIYVEI